MTLTPELDDRIGTHRWTEAQDFGQGARQMCADCGHYRSRATEHSHCPGRQRSTAPVPSDYDPFAG